jgi:hypothetical protein
MRAVGGQVGETQRNPFELGLDRHVDQAVEAAVSDRIDGGRMLAEKKGRSFQAIEIAPRSARPMA